MNLFLLREDYQQGSAVNINAQGFAIVAEKGHIFKMLLGCWTAGRT